MFSLGVFSCTATSSGSIWGARGLFSPRVLPIPPQKRVDLSPLILSSQKGSKSSLLSSHPKKSKPLSYVLQEYLDFKLDYLPAGDVFLLINPLGSSSQKAEGSALALLLPCAPPAMEKGSLEVSFKRQRRTEAGTHASLEGTSEMSSDRFNKQRKPTGLPCGAEVQRKAGPGKPPGAWKCHPQPSLQPHACTSVLTWSQTVSAQALWFFRSAPRPEAEPSSPTTLTQGCCFLHLNTLSGKSCSYS